jgi:chaperone BCS1
MSSQPSLPVASPHNLSKSPFQSLKSSYDIAIYLVKDILGLDPVFIVNLSLFLAAVSAAGRYVSNFLYHYAKTLFVSSVHINDDDVLYASILRWMADHHVGSRTPRAVKAITVTKSTLQDEEDAMKSLEADFDNSERLISYRTMIARSPILFQPFESQHLILHKRNLILFKHHLRSSDSRSERSYLTLECLGRSLSPIQLLLEDVQTYSIEKTASTTAVFRADGSWYKTMSRPHRDIDTVILEKDKKQALLRDINEYLHPRTRKWYSNHGIPYRRGYLFSGAPGTGKTSLTAALAGVFGLDIYVLSLLDAGLSETTLVRLLGAVPSRCIVLIEDVDAAGLGKRPDASAKKELTVSDTGSAADAPETSAPVTSISLSGFLNAIDGVSSNEGRILIMTTNNPEALDKALIRPGRVDMHIRFALPTNVEIRELYLSMYKDMEHGKSETESAEPRPSSSNSLPTLTTEELQKLSQTFAGSLPENRLSLAAIQGFLLSYKRNPQMAAEKAKDWAEEALKEIKGA